MEASLIYRNSDNVTITRGVTFVNHDGGIALFRHKYPDVNTFGKIKIGNNVFIGINSIILSGVTVGDKNVPSNVVVAGVPAKIIKTIDEYEEKILKNAVSIKAKNKKERKREIINSFMNR